MTNLSDISLHGAHLVVFGGSTGIGLATAAAAKSRGASVTLVGRTPAKLERAAREIGATRIAVADIADRNSVTATFHELTRVDHLVIAAGSLRVGRLSDTDPDELLAAVEERVAGSVYAVRAALPLMPPTGSIVLMSGQLADRPTAGGTAVISAAIAGVEGLGRALALELKPIRVNVIAPGFIDTPLWDHFGLDGRAAILKQAATLLPGGRVGRPEEVAQAILFLMGNRYMNAEVVHVDGAGRLV